jgi:4-hydroxy-tetrahydrodipicolinate synthase
MRIHGTYPMLYAFFDAAGRLRRDAFARQVEAAVASGAVGVACLGLGTEGTKLGRDEQRQVVGWVIGQAAGRLPVAVTVAGGNGPDMIEAARHAEGAGAAWLILQPPPPPASGADLVGFFAGVAAATALPCAIQNAPEFLGIGLTAAELLDLNRRQPNVALVKAEASAVAVGRMIAALDGRMAVFNGRAGLELTDNWRAGVAGMIPGVETVDRQVAVERAMHAGDETVAEALYRDMLPALVFAMQGVAAFVCYGKLIAALRLGIDPGTPRLPAEVATDQGLAWARRLAGALGPLPA